LKIDAVRLVNFAYFHSIMMYEAVFWGNSTYGRKVFNVQKKTVRIMAGG
jgi:hypothetical protein